MPRVTLGLPTHDRHAYLAAAIESGLAQDHDDFELLICLDGTTAPEALAVVDAASADPRVRVVAHERNRGIAAAINTIVREARGELIALTGDDDLCLPGRLTRQVAVFDRFPDTGVVHGDATIIDGDGRTTGAWRSRDFSRHGLVHALLREHNFIVDPSTMRHRRVHDALGPVDEDLPWEDFAFHVRAARRFRYRHCGGEPVVAYRRHEANASREGDPRELELVETVLERALEEYDLEELVPELDWPVLDRAEGERQALLVLADALERRGLPLPGLAARVRERATALPAPAPRTAATGGRESKRIVMTSFGFDDPGGGTTVPRLAAKELARRGWDVTVFHAATAPIPGAPPYEISEREVDGVRLVGVHNRPSALWDLGRPDRELDDPPITAAFGALLDRVTPDVVHFHNLHNLGAALIDEAAARGLPSYFSTHNYWLICPRAYLLTGRGDRCGGPGDRGGDCAGCVRSPDVDGHRRRLEGIRARFSRGVTACLAVSDAVRATLLGQGYPAEMVDVVRQGMPGAQRVWERLGRDRVPGRLGHELVVGFFGSAYWHKGPQLLVEAAQRTEARIRVQIHGEVPDQMAAALRGADRRGVVEVMGAFSASDLPELLAGVDAAAMPSLWWDCAPLAAAECLAGGVPLLAPRMGGLAEAVRDEVDGLLFDGGDAAGLAAALDRLASEPGLLERLQAGIEPPRPFAAYVDDLEAYYAGDRPGRVPTHGLRPRVPGPAGEPAVRWVGDHDAPTSLSIVNRNATTRLAAAGMPVQRVDRAGRELDPPLPRAADVEVRHQWPPDLRPPAAGRLAVIQPWEFGAPPRAWLDPLRDDVDELWVPSAYVRGMYVEAGLDPARVHVVPNGVDLERFSPQGPVMELPVADDAVRLLFVGGAIWRKGIDLLLAAFDAAFAGRDEVVLVVKDFGAGGVYANADREALHARAAGGSPRVLVLDDELPDDRLPALYRACDALVAPYRGEGFCMPVLEAMACGLPVLVTEGGPTDEFCPPDAGWRIPALRAALPEQRIDRFETAGTPWVLEPDPERLAGLLGQAFAQARGIVTARGAGPRGPRGARAAQAAQRMGWDAVAQLYAERVRALAQAPPRHAATAAAPADLPSRARRRVLATPAWHGEDRLADLLEAWAAAAPAGTDAALFLPVDGNPADVARHVAEAAARRGTDLDRAADVVLLPHPASSTADARLHEAVGAYVPLHDGCAGHQRLAREAGAAILAPEHDALARWLRTAEVPSRAADHRPA